MVKVSEFFSKPVAYVSLRRRRGLCEVSFAEHKVLSRGCAEGPVVEAFDGRCVG